MHLLGSLVVVAAWGGLALVAVARADDRRADRLRLGALALAIRAGAAGLVSVVLAASGRAFVFPDEAVFLSEAASVRRGGPFSSHGYSNLLGLLFKVTGESAWVPRALNVVAGAVLAVVVYELALLLAGRRVARLAGLAVACWPSLVLWSVLPLKDPLTVLAAFCALLGGVVALRGRWWGGAVALGAMVALEGLRPYAFVVASVSLAVGLAARFGLGPARRLAAGVVLVLALGGLGWVGGEGFLGVGFVRTHADTEVVAKARVEGQAGSTGFGSGRPRSAGEVAQGVPRGLLYTMLGPFPWDAGEDEARALLVVELPLWYAAMAAAVVGLLRLGWRRLRLRWAGPLTFGAGVVAVLAVYEANAGTAIRQRAMVVPLVLALAASSLKAARLVGRADRLWR